MCLQLREALATKRIVFSNAFFSSTGVAETKQQLESELRFFSVITEAPKTPFGKSKKTYTGKTAGRNDDLARVRCTKQTHTTTIRFIILPFARLQTNTNTHTHRRSVCSSPWPVRGSSTRASATAASATPPRDTRTTTPAAHSSDGRLELELAVGESGRILLAFRLILLRDFLEVFLFRLFLRLLLLLVFF